MENPQEKAAHPRMMLSTTRQFLHYEDGAGTKPQNQLQDERGGIVGSTLLTPAFVRKYPNMINNHGFKLKTDDVKVWLEK